MKQETPAWTTGRKRAALSQSAQAPAPEMQRFQPNARGSKRRLGIIARCEDSYRQNQWRCQRAVRTTFWPTLPGVVPTLRQKRLNTAGEGAREGGEREASAGNAV